MIFESVSRWGWSSFVRDLTIARGKGATTFRPGRLIDLDLTDPGEIVDAVTDVLGISDRISIAERGVLINYLTDEGAQATVDLLDEEVVDRKLAGLFAVIMQSPAYQLH